MSSARQGIVNIQNISSPGSNCRNIGMQFSLMGERISLEASPSRRMSLGADFLPVSD
ncbi:MAG: hypothetical protein K6L60_12680 [Oceanobacter sp.]